MATLGSLNLVLGADSTQLRQELGKVRQESQATALAITNLFSGDTINAVSFRLIRGTVMGLINDIDELNNGLSITDSLTRNLAGSFNDMGDIALLQLGQIAQFLGDDLFQTPLQGLQSQSLENVGLGQLEGAFKIVSAGSNAVRILEVGITGLTSSFEFLDSVLDTFQGEAQSVANFFAQIADNAQFVSDILKATATIIDGAIEQVLDSLEATFPAIGLLREGAKALGLEFSVGKSLLGDYVEQLDRIEASAKTAGDAAQGVADGAGSARAGIKGANGALEQFGSNLDAQRKAAAGFEDAMKDLADAAVLLDQYRQVSEVFDSVFGSLEQNFQAANQADILNNQLQLVSESAGGAGEDLEFLSETTEELGLDFDTAAAGFVQFSTAASLAGITANQTKDIFEGIAQSTSVMGLSAADTQGVFLALQQILSSGNLQLEELNQIAERVPGAFQAAAAALGVTTSELKGLVSTGKVDSKTFLVGFAQQLKNFTASGVTDAMDSGTAAVNRFNNALGNFQIAAGQAWLQVGTPALNTFSKAIEFAAENEELFSSAIDAVLISSIPLFISGVSKATVATIQFIAANKTASLSLFGQQIKFTAAELGKYAANLALAYAAVLVFYRVLDRTKDGAQSLQDAIKSLDKSIADLNETAGNTPDLEDIVPTEPAPTDWLDSIVQAYNDLPLLGEELDRKLGIDGLLDITTNAEKRANDYLVTLGDFGEKARAILDESFQLRTDANQGMGAIAEIERLDAALKTLEGRKAGIDPNDEKAVAAILAEEEDLLKRRSEAQQEVLATQSAINNALAQSKQELQNLDPSKLGQEGFESAKTQLESQIKLLETEKARLDEVATTATATAKTITEEFKDSSGSLESAFANQQAAIAEALASGSITQEQALQQNLEVEKQYLQDRIKNNQDALKDLKAALEQDAKLRAVDPNAAGLLSQEQLDQYKQQITQIEQQVTQDRISLANTVSEEKKAVLDKELADFEAHNSAIESAAQTTTNNQIAAVRQRQLAGAVSAEEAEKQIAAIQEQGAKDEINRLKNQLNEVDGLLQRGVISEQEAATRRQDINQQLSEANLSLVEADVQAREQANREAVQDFEDATRNATRAIESSQQQRITAVKQAQLSGVIGEEEAQSRIAAIQEDGIAQTIVAKQSEIAQIQALRDQGKLGAEEAANREAELTQDIGNLKIDQIEAELEAQRNARAEIIKGIEEEFELRQSKLSTRSESLGLQSGSLQSEKELLTARLDLTNSLATLEQERLNTRIAQAEVNGNDAEVERLKGQQLQLQSEQIDRQYAAQLEQLKIDQQLKQIDLDRQKLSAQIAQLEAQAALEKARAEGASAAELQSLQQILSLRQQQVDAVDSAIAQQDAMNAIQRQSLDTQYQISQEQQRQAEIQQQQIKNEGVIAALSDKTSKSRKEQAKELKAIQDAARKAQREGFISEQQFQQINSATRQIGRSSNNDPFDLARASVQNQSNPFFNQILSQVGRNDALGLAGLLNQNSVNAVRSGIGSGIPADSPLRQAGVTGQIAGATTAATPVSVVNLVEVTTRLDAIQNVLKSVGLRPNLNVSSPQPIADAARVYADIASKAANI